MDLFRYWQERKTLIDAKIDDFINQNGDWNIIELSKYMLRDGKRFRGLLVMLVAEFFGSSEEKAIDGALAVEILHAASLALDDIMDGDLERRGKKAAWVVFGNKKVILATNYLIPSALRIISKYGDEALKISVDLWRNIGVGALRDTFETPDYIDIIELKTGSFFELSTALGIFASGESTYLPEALQLGRSLGIQYQIIDDYMDILKFKGKLDKLIGSAAVLYKNFGKNVEEYVNTQLDYYMRLYLSTLGEIKIDNEYRKIMSDLPQLFLSQLKAEELSSG
ncbi:geranylgeranyl pyrophosphate synthase [Sulfolobales archaeon HS-7]|nr:geranylgeranyl pyrophosphate synthase [Sulfolobales archaeon HS-7]